MTTSKLRATTAVLAATVTAGMSASSAAGHGIVDAKLAIRSENAVGASPVFHVSVDGVARMTQTRAQGLIDSGHKIVVRVWGEDLFSDDLLLGPYVLTKSSVRFGHVRATPQGLAFALYQKVPWNTLDEDRDPGPGGASDEIYAGVRLLNAAGASIASHETRRYSGLAGQGGLDRDICPNNHVGCP